jgi:hypothetical protein
VSGPDSPGGAALTGTPAPPPAASVDRVAAARELLVRTAELPDTKRELLDVLSEYRTALFAFAVSGAKPAATASMRRGPPDTARTWARPCR